MLLVRDVHSLTAGFPKAESFGLIAQMRRCVVSIPSNIAEGAARRSRADLAQFVGIAQGSLSELDTQLEIAMLLEYVSRETPIMARIERVFSLLLGLARSLQVPR